MEKILKAIVVVQLFLIVFLGLVLTGVLDWDNDPIANKQEPIFKSTVNNYSSSNQANFEREFAREANRLNKLALSSVEDDHEKDVSLSSLFKPQLKRPVDGSPITVDLKQIQKKNFFIPEEIYQLEVKDDLWGYFPNSEERFEHLKKMDEGLSLVNYRSKNFDSSPLAQALASSKKTSIYVLLEFTKPINPESFYRLRSYGVSPIPNLKRGQYYRKHAAVFYVPYGKLTNIRNSKNIKNIYILENYTASAKYQLGIKSSKSIESIKFNINYPYSKPGLLISNLSYDFKGVGTFEEIDTPEKNLLTVRTPVVQNELYLFSSSYTLKVDLLENLKRNFVVSAKGVTLEQYREEIKATPEIGEIFTRPGEKIVTSDYVSQILSQINTDMDISGIWKQISFILDKDIEYDWQKRELFFSGNLPYYNIKDMYLNVKELSEKKVGACTERTALEIAILRELGISARSATRVYHIFTEIYLPKKGWLSTSLILNEIPLCHSYDENMAYFIEWDKSFPIRLKWVGKIIPKILEKLFTASELAKR